MRSVSFVRRTRFYGKLGVAREEEPSARIFFNLRSHQDIFNHRQHFAPVPPSSSASLQRPATVFAGQRLGIKEVDDGVWLVSFTHYDLGYFDLEQRTLQPLDNPFGTRLSPMS